MVKQYRKKAAAVDEEEEEHVDIRTIIEETRAQQELRARPKGLTVDESGLLVVPKHESAAPAPARAPASGEAAAFEGGFAGETATAPEEDPNLAKFVEAEMRKRRGLAADASAGADGARGAAGGGLADLYATPAHLQIGKRADDDMAAGMTGLAEVELPVSVKLANIEATELAKQALLDKQQAKMNRSLGIKSRGGGGRGGGGAGGEAAPVPRMPIGPYFGGKEMQEQGSLAARAMDKQQRRIAMSFHHHGGGGHGGGHGGGGPPGGDGASAPAGEEGAEGGAGTGPEPGFKPSFRERAKKRTSVHAEGVSSDAFIMQRFVSRERKRFK